MRAALVELAWRMVRFQPQYPPVAKRLGVLCKAPAPLARGARKPLWLSRVTWRWICGDYRPARASAPQLGLTLGKCQEKANKGSR